MAAEKQSNDSKHDKQVAAKKRVTKLAAPPQAQAPGPELVQLALADPAAVAPSVILALQRSHGNQTVQRLIQQSQAARDAETAQATTEAPPEIALEQVVHTVVRRPKLTSATSTTSPMAEPLSNFSEVDSLAPGLWQSMEDYVPPIAPPALPPDDNPDPRHKVGSPFRHLDGVSNRKAQAKYRLGPTGHWEGYDEKNALAIKFVADPQAGPPAMPAGRGQ